MSFICGESYNTKVYIIELQKYKLIVYLQRQVLHDLLLQNPPGWEHSKGPWLSDAM
jgi:hypothetical protein